MAKEIREMEDTRKDENKAFLIAKSDDEKSCFSSTETSPRATTHSKKRKKTKTRAPHKATGSDAF